MRDLFAGAIALALLFVAAGLATTLQEFRRRRKRVRDAERSRGRAIVAEIPAGDDLVLFTEDAARFYYGDRPIEKDRIAAVRMLINGAPIASCVSRRADLVARAAPTHVEDHPEGIVRDRWDVAVEAFDGTTLVECGAIRERVSQELARAVFDAVKRDLERRDEGGQRGTERTER